MGVLAPRRPRAPRGLLYRGSSDSMWAASEAAPAWEVGLEEGGVEEEEEDLAPLPNCTPTAAAAMAADLASMSVCVG